MRVLEKVLLRIICPYINMTKKSTVVLYWKTKALENIVRLPTIRLQVLIVTTPLLSNSTQTITYVPQIYPDESR